MNRHSSFRINPFLAAVIVVAGFFLVLITAYGITKNASKNEVMGRVEVVGTPIGGMTEEEAITAVLTVEDEYIARPATFTIEDETVTLIPAYAGFDIDENAVVTEALMVGREGNAAYQFLWWIKHIFSTEEVDLVGATDPEAIEVVFDDWDARVIDQPVSLGAIEMLDGVPQPVYPRTGVGLDRTESTTIIEAQLLVADPQEQPLPATTIVPALTDADIDEALLEANLLISEPIRMVYNGSELIFTPDQLAEAYRSRTIAEGTPQIVHSFDPETIDKYLDPIRADYEAEPVNAEFVISGDQISIVPGSSGTRIDEVETAQKLLQAGQTTGRLGQLPLVEDAEPDVTTAELEALGIEHLVSSFTTYHPCCAGRVNNIQTMANTIDETILLSGREFSINGFVGQRTPEKGYVPAGTIVAGELEDTVGGGVSQFATTMYNAIFWAGLQDIEHKPHSYYFSRYPEGIEATVNWQTPNLIFRNNTDHAIMIDTRYTDTSITVRIFGDNDGRTVVGEQSGGSTKMSVVNRGGPDALHVEGSVSGRFNQTNPGPPRYEANPALDVNTVITQQEEQGGWSVTVTRTIKRGGTHLVDTQEWIVRYLPQFAVYEVNPCMIPGNEDTCPTSTTVVTTTTLPPQVTTTTSG